MERALADAGLASGTIRYLNLHGTGTPHNDAMESLAVARVFEAPPPCSSTKPLTGHTLAAAGAIEAALCWLVLHESRGGPLVLPPHRGGDVPDPELPALPLVADGTRVARGPVMSTSFGFGGSNCALVLEDVP